MSGCVCVRRFLLCARPTKAFALRLELEVIRQLSAILHTLRDLHLVPVLVGARVLDQFALEELSLLVQIPVQRLRWLSKAKMSVTQHFDSISDFYLTKTTVTIITRAAPFWRR